MNQYYSNGLPIERRSVTQGHVQVYEEVPILVPREVQVPYDVIIERPVENIIENRYYKDVVVERPIEKFVDVPVEVIREEKKIVQVPRMVEVPRYVDRPYERVVEVPTETIREVPVPYETIVNREVERPLVRPHRTEYIQDNVVVEKPVMVDRYVDRNVEVEVPVYREREIEKIVDVEERVYRDIPYEVPRYVEVTKEVPFQRIIEVPTETIVERPVTVDRVVEQYYDVERVVERRREVPFERVVEKPVYVDRVIEVPIETRMEVPYIMQKQVERIRHLDVNVPVVQTSEISVPVPRVVEEPFEVIEELIQPREKVVERLVEYPRYKVRETFENIEIDVPVERFVDEPVYIDKEIDVEVIKERFVERPVDRVVEKIVELQKTIEKPIFNPKIVEKRKEKIVERRVEVPVERYVEVPHYVEVKKHINVVNNFTRPRLVEKKSHRALRKSVKKVGVSSFQKQQFTSLGETLNQQRLANIKLDLEVSLLREQLDGLHRVVKNPSDVGAENAELRRKIGELEQRWGSLRSENARLAGVPGLVSERTQVHLFSEEEVRLAERQLVEVEQKNARLRQALGEVGVTSRGVTQGAVTSLTPPPPPPRVSQTVDFLPPTQQLTTFVPAKYVSTFVDPVPVVAPVLHTQTQEAHHFQRVNDLPVVHNPFLVTTTPSPSPQTIRTGFTNGQAYSQAFAQAQSQAYTQAQTQAFAQSQAYAQQPKYSIESVQTSAYSPRGRNFMDDQFRYSASVAEGAAKPPAFTFGGSPIAYQKDSVGFRSDSSGYGVGPGFGGLGQPDFGPRNSREIKQSVTNLPFLQAFEQSVRHR